MKKLILFFCLLFTVFTSSATISWMGNHTKSAQPANSQTIHFYVEMWDSYAGCHAEVLLNEAGTWVSYTLNQGANNVNNSTWTADINVKSNSTAYYFHGWDDWGANVYDNNGGSNYTISINPTTKSGGDGNWNNGNNWCDGTTPSSISATYIIAHDLTLNIPFTVGSLVINSGVTLTASDATPRVLTISMGGSLANNGTFTHANGLVSFAGAGTVTGTVVFNDVSIAGGVDFGSGTTINGTLTINSGGYGVNASPPAYASGSTLRYNTGGTYARNTEWGSATNPHHVTISNTTILDMGANGGTGVDRQCMGNLTIDAGSTFSMNATPMSNDIVIGGNVSNNGTIIQSSNSGSDIFVKGDWVANNTLTHNDRAIFFNGTAAQEIRSGITNFGYLLVANTSGVSINGSGLITVDRNLTISPNSVLKIKPGKSITVSGDIINNGGNTGLIIESTSAGTGSLLHNTADVPGTIERYVTGDDALSIFKYHFVSVPLEPDNNSLSGIFLDSYLFHFDESLNDWYGLGTPTTTPLNEYRGYMIYTPQDAGDTFEFEGEMNNSSFAPFLSYTDRGPDIRFEGWNLIPNPYPSALNWPSVTRTNVDAAIYIWPSSAGAGADEDNYYTYASGISSPAGVMNGEISIGQSFFVHANDISPSITFSNNDRVHSTQPFFKNGAEIIPNLLRFKASTDLSSDEIVVRIHEDATENFDNEFDAYKLNGGANAPQLASITQDGTKLSINSLPFSATEKIIPLSFSLSQASEVVFTATGQESFAMTPPIYLEDLLLNKVVNLQQQPEYTFAYEPGQANRFQLRFLNITSSATIAQNEAVVYYGNSKLNIDIPSMEGNYAIVNIYDVTGRILKTSNTTLQGITQVDAPAKTGVYIVRIICGNKTFVEKVVVR